MERIRQICHDGHGNNTRYLQNIQNHILAGPDHPSNTTHDARLLHSPQPPFQVGNDVRRLYNDIRLVIPDPWELDDWI